MATRATLRARVRRELGDTLAIQTWPDEQINDHLADALREVSYALPRDPVALTFSTVTDQREYALGVDAAEVVGVEFPLGTLLPRAASIVPAEATPDMPNRVYANAWTANIQTGTVRLETAPSDSVSKLRVYYRPLLVAPSDDSTTVALEADEEALAALMACRSLWDLRLMEDAKRGHRTPGGNVFASRVEAMLSRRRRRVQVGNLASVPG